MSNNTIIVLWVIMIFLYSSSLSSCHLFLISSALLIPYVFCPLLCPSCMKYSLGVSNFLEEISSLSHSIVFLYFFELNTKEVFCISPCHSWNSAFKWVYLSFSLCLWLLFFSQLFVRTPQTTILLLCISFS